jgi:hypothetical protein
VLGGFVKKPMLKYIMKISKLILIYLIMGISAGMTGSLDSSKME